MTRKSQRLSGPPPIPKHKRVASNSTSLSAEKKQSKRQKATPIKSQYFGTSTDRGESLGDDEPEFDDSTSKDEDASDFGSEPDPSSPSDGNHDDYGSESDEKPKKGKKAAPNKVRTSSAAVTVNEKDLLKPGVKTGLGPGTQVVIKKPKARPAGKTPYQDETIHPNTLLFLKDLKANNERPWLKMHDADFRQSERDWHSFAAKLTERLIEIDDTVPELPVKDIIFRIYRDIRFSPDPTPYKPHFSAAWSRTGRKGPYAHYYVQISPNNQSFVGGGLWHPEAAPVAAMRRDIDRHPNRLKGVLMLDDLRTEFLDKAPKNEAKTVKSFASANSGNALKTKPKGYDADHAEISLLRLRNYTIGRTLTEAEVLSAGSLDRIAALLACMKPFITYLNSVVRPDEEESGESEDEDASAENSNSMSEEDD